MDASRTYEVYEQTFEDLRVAAERGDQGMAATVCRRARGYAAELRDAAMLAIEDVAGHEPKRSLEIFQR